MADRGGWPGYAEQVTGLRIQDALGHCRVKLVGRYHVPVHMCALRAALTVHTTTPLPYQQVAHQSVGLYGPPSSSQDVPQRGRQLHREPAAAPQLCGSWQLTGGPGACADCHIRSLSAPPAELAERWAAAHAGHPPLELRPQPDGWQHAARPGPSTHVGNQALPLLAEAPAQPSPSALLPAEQQEWLKRRLAQAQQQLARQRAEQAQWAAAASQLLRGRGTQLHRHPAAVCEEPRCPTCGGSNQDSTEVDSQQELEGLIEGLEAEMEAQLHALQRQQRWEQPQQAQRRQQLPAQPLGAPSKWLRQQQVPSADTPWERQQQEQEQQALLRLDQAHWQRAAAAAMQQQSQGGRPLSQPAGQLGQPFPMGPQGVGQGYSASDEMFAPVRMSAPARLEKQRQVKHKAATGCTQCLRRLLRMS